MTNLLCSESQWASALKLRADTGIDHAVIDVANKKGSYQKVVPHTDEELRIHGQKGAVTTLASTKYGRGQ